MATHLAATLPGTITVSHPDDNTIYREPGHSQNDKHEEKHRPALVPIAMSQAILLNTQALERASCTLGSRTDQKTQAQEPHLRHKTGIKITRSPERRGKPVRCRQSIGAQEVRLQRPVRTWKTPNHQHFGNQRHRAVEQCLKAQYQIGLTTLWKRRPSRAATLQCNTAAPDTRLNTPEPLAVSPAGCVGRARYAPDCQQRHSNQAHHG